MEERYNRIKKEYDSLYREMLSKGRLAQKDTGIGYWSIAAADDIFELFRKLDLTRFSRFIDLGSGDGKVSMIASLFTQSHGVEYDKELHQHALQIKHKLNGGAVFFNKDFMQHDLSRYDIAFIHPDKVMHEIEAKIKQEFKGTLVVYGNLHQPSTLKKNKELTASGTPVSLYRV